MNRRNTKQRDLVLDAVRSLHDHATAQEVYELVIKKNPTISRGTVYRNLNLLAQENQIRKIETGQGPEHFDHRVMKHYHVLCTRCQKLYDVEMDLLEGLEKNIRDSYGAIIVDYDIQFKGICLNCQKKEKENE